VPNRLSGSDNPVPPPLDYPLKPRPRVSTVLHHIRPDGDPNHHSTHDPPSHTLLGPPYSLLVLEDAQLQNAFAYGFGPHGGGGVVVYTGFIDEVLRRHASPPEEVTSPAEAPSLWSRLTGGPPSPPAQKEFTPTPEQTTELAILLAHEMSHLILSHHLETLSSGSIVIPAVVSIFTDVARTLLFPVTMMLGPFLNDALLEMSKISVGEITSSSDACRNRTLEVEADLVSARLLAYAGFDPRAAIQFWESRAEAETCASKNKDGKDLQDKPHWFSGMAKRDGHPIGEIRVDKLKKELSTWEKTQ
jgi:Zn-dependent protease with chaperone function